MLLCLSAVVFALQVLLVASASHLSRMNIQDLSNLLAALPALRTSPDQTWLDELCT
jgi:hypothetical protein